MEVVAEQVRTEPAEHFARIAQLESCARDLKGKTYLLEHRNNVADSLHYLLVDEFHLL